jgi:hypothetical protein
MKRLFCFLTAWLGLHALCGAAPPTAAERKEILDAARPVASEIARQPVRFVVDRLNVDSNWALMTGKLVQANGNAVDWRKVSGCELDLDKILWVVMAKADGSWRVAQMEVCSPEPLSWGMPGLFWPCGVYAGLTDANNKDLERECLARRKK